MLLQLLCHLLLHVAAHLLRRHCEGKIAFATLAWLPVVCSGLYSSVWFGLRIIWIGASVLLERASKGQAERSCVSTPGIRTECRQTISVTVELACEETSMCYGVQIRWPLGS